MVDHYFGVAPGARGPGRTLEAELISGFELGHWRDKVRTPRDAPCFVTAQEQYAWGGINRYSTWDQDLVRRVLVESRAAVETWMAGTNQP
jgi:hypothetical protein